MNKQPFNGWEFFALKVSADGTTILDRGDKVLNTSSKKPCLDCHSPAAKFDFVCEKRDGCAPIPVTDRQMAKCSPPTSVVKSDALRPRPGNSVRRRS